MPPFADRVAVLVVALVAVATMEFGLPLLIIVGLFILLWCSAVARWQAQPIWSINPWGLREGSRALRENQAAELGRRQSFASNLHVLRAIAVLCMAVGVAGVAASWSTGGPLPPPSDREGIRPNPDGGCKTHKPLPGMGCLSD